MVSEYAEKGFSSSKNLYSGLIAGGVAGVVMGLMIQFIMGIMPVIGALYVGRPNLVVGWIAHLFHSTVFALVFVALVSTDSLSSRMDSYLGSIGIGLIYGAVLWAVAAVFVMPIWLASIGLQAPPVPNINPQSLVGHLVFGGLLGAVYKFGLEKLH